MLSKEEFVAGLVAGITDHADTLYQGYLKTRTEGLLFRRSSGPLSTPEFSPTPARMSADEVSADEDLLRESKDIEELGLCFAQTAIRLGLITL